MSCGLKSENWQNGEKDKNERKYEQHPANDEEREVNFILRISDGVCGMRSLRAEASSSSCRLECVYTLPHPRPRERRSPQWLPYSPCPQYFSLFEFLSKEPVVVLLAESTETAGLWRQGSKTAWLLRPQQYARFPAARVCFLSACSTKTISSAVVLGVDKESPLSTSSYH